MDAKKTGELLSRLRRDRGLTQREAAAYLHVSDRTISKWERGIGLPDISLLQEISAIYGVEIEAILKGNLEERGVETGNMKRMTFVRCTNCGNIFWSTGGGEISCCSRKLEPLKAQPMDEAHDVTLEEMGGEYYLTFSHEMKKEHSIVFAALVSWDRVTVVRLYPEQAGEVHLPRQRRGTLYLCCSEHGLFQKKI